MKRRMMLVAGAALAINFALPLAVRADQAIFANDAILKLAPGQSVEHNDTLVLSRFGIPTVVFDAGATGFADNETVVATITLSTADMDFGAVELLSPASITGTIPTGWTTNPPDTSASDFTFDPPISFRYTAPSAAALDCAGHPGETFRTRIGVTATLVGSEGTTASFSALDFPGVLNVEVMCEPAAPTAQITPPPTADVTPPPTDMAGRSATEAPTPSFAVWFAIFGAALVVVAVAAALTRRIS